MQLREWYLYVWQGGGGHASRSPLPENRSSTRMFARHGPYPQPARSRVFFTDWLLCCWRLCPRGLLPQTGVPLSEQGDFWPSSGSPTVTSVSANSPLQHGLCSCSFHDPGAILPAEAAPLYSPQRVFPEGSRQPDTLQEGRTRTRRGFRVKAWKYIFHVNMPLRPIVRHHFIFLSAGLMTDSFADLYKSLGLQSVFHHAYIHSLSTEPRLRACAVPRQCLGTGA